MFSGDLLILARNTGGEFLGLFFLGYFSHRNVAGLLQPGRKIATLAAAQSAAPLACGVVTFYVELVR
jgi:hypothetical protein